MKKWQKIFLGVIGGIILLVIIDLGCVFLIKRPIFAIKKNNGAVYKGLFYDIYACEEYSLPQIKVKGTKYTCIDLNNKENKNKIKKIIDGTKENFNCDEALENFYEDENYIYSWSCIKNKYMVVKYEDGKEETVESALKNKNITIKDLDNANIDYIKSEKEKHSVVNFELIFNPKPGNVKKQIVDKNTNKLYNYNVYIWDGDVQIVIDNKAYPLADALNENKITMDEIIAKANKDIPNAPSYDDGGSREYHYDNYTIIKFYTLDGNRDVYIGNEKLSLIDIK